MTRLICVTHAVPNRRIDIGLPGSTYSGNFAFMATGLLAFSALFASFPDQASACPGIRFQDETAGDQTPTQQEPIDDKPETEPSATENPDTDPLPGTQQDSPIQPGSEPMQDSDTEMNNEPTQVSGDTGQAAVPDLAFQQFQKLIQELQSNERLINQMVISMPVGFQDKRLAQQAKVDALRARNQAILGELKPLAVASFEQFPNTQQSVTTYLFQNLQLQLTGKNYRFVPFNPFGAIELYQRLATGGVELPVLQMFGYRALYVLNDFEGAKKSLLKAAEMGQQLEPQIWEDLKQMGEAWNRELEFRKKDKEKENPLVKIEMDCGVMIAELYEDQAPNTVANFISLVEDGYYNGLIFYQVNPTEVAVTGSPTNDGQGGPGYEIAMETTGEDIRHHFTGVLSMLGDGQNHAASRFLITKQPRLQFNGRMSAFGRIVEGLENLYKIQVVNRTTALSKEDVTIPTRINKMTVVRKRDHEYIPEKATDNPAGIPGG